MMTAQKISIPDWISCHTYFFGREESRTYISNERSHEYIQLDGISSDLWKLIYDGVGSDVLLAFAEQNGVEAELDGFIDTLREQGLVVLPGVEQASETDYAPVCDNAATLDEELSFTEEMKTWLFENKFMFSLFFELTYRCNLKCVHCYNPKHMNNVEIDFELCKKAIDDAYEVGCFRVTFSGGESFLHSRFLELVKYAREKHMSVEIFTNGQALAGNEKLYEEIKSLYPYRVCVSLYSTDEKMHDRVTAVEGSFNKTYPLINRMKRDNMNVQIKNFLLNFNCMDCIGVKKYAAEIGATSVADISLIPTIEGDKKTMEFLLSEDELFELYTNPDSPLYISEDFKPLALSDRQNSTPCSGGYTGLCVSPTGEVVICVSLPYSVGNLNRESVKSIWQAAMEKDEDSRLYQWQQVTLADLTECYREDYCAFCSYCPGMGYLENGYLKKSDVQCAEARAKMKAYLYLKEKRSACSRKRNNGVQE